MKEYCFGGTVQGIIGKKLNFEDNFLRSKKSINTFIYAGFAHFAHRRKKNLQIKLLKSDFLPIFGLTIAI